MRRYGVWEGMLLRFRGTVERNEVCRAISGIEHITYDNAVRVFGAAVTKEPIDCITLEMIDGH